MLKYNKIYFLSFKRFIKDKYKDLIFLLLLFLTIAFQSQDAIKDLSREIKLIIFIFVGVIISMAGKNLYKLIIKDQPLVERFAGIKYASKSSLFKHIVITLSLCFLGNYIFNKLFGVNQPISLLVFPALYLLVTLISTSTFRHRIIFRLPVTNNKVWNHVAIRSKHYLRSWGTPIIILYGTVGIFGILKIEIPSAYILNTFNILICVSVDSLIPATTSQSFRLHTKAWVRYDVIASALWSLIVFTTLSLILNIFYYFKSELYLNVLECLSAAFICFYLSVCVAIVNARFPHSAVIRVIALPIVILLPAVGPLYLYYQIKRSPSMFNIDKLSFSYGNNEIFLKTSHFI